MASDRNAPRWVTALLVIIGIACIVAGVIYFAEPAGKLPSFFPGHQGGSTHHHIKHGIGAIVVGLLAFLGAWFTTGKKSATT